MVMCKLHLYQYIDWWWCVNFTFRLLTKRYKITNYPSAVFIENSSEFTKSCRCTRQVFWWAYLASLYLSLIFIYFPQFTLPIAPVSYTLSSQQISPWTAWKSSSWHNRCLPSDWIRSFILYPHNWIYVLFTRWVYQDVHITNCYPRSRWTTCNFSLDQS